jgi:hypothetical protein
MRSKANKLHLSKETLRILTWGDLEGVVGGRRTNEATGYNSCGSCNTLCPAPGCEDPSILYTCGCVGETRIC